MNILKLTMLAFVIMLVAIVGLSYKVYDMSNLKTNRVHNISPTGAKSCATFLEKREDWILIKNKQLNLNTTNQINAYLPRAFDNFELSGWFQGFIDGNGKFIELATIDYNAFMAFGEKFCKDNPTQNIDGLGHAFIEKITLK